MITFKKKLKFVKGFGNKNNIAVVYTVRQMIKFKLKKSQFLDHSMQYLGNEVTKTYFS